MSLKKVAFLYPLDPFNSRIVDESYREEYTMVQDAGLSVHCINIDEILTSPIIPSVQEDSLLIYRGWMLNGDSYDQLEQRFGSQLYTPKKEYLTAHYLPNWYNDLELLTIPSIITDEEGALEAFKKFDGKAFIKDYVKSLKTGKGSIIANEDDISRAIKDMKFYRGDIEGGIVLRKVVDLNPASETRFFVVNNTIFSPVDNDKKYALAQEVVKKIGHKNLKFYSVDVALTLAGDPILIEIGDGQVSDYVGWELKDFMHVLKDLAK